MMGNLHTLQFMYLKSTKEGKKRIGEDLNKICKLHRIINIDASVGCWDEMKNLES